MKGLKMMKNEGKQLDYKDMVNFKMYDVTTWLTNSGITHIDQHLKK